MCIEMKSFTSESSRVWRVFEPSVLHRVSGSLSARVCVQIRAKHSGISASAPASYLFMQVDTSVAKVAADTSTAIYSHSITQKRLILDLRFYSSDQTQALSWGAFDGAKPHWKLIKAIKHKTWLFKTHRYHIQTKTLTLCKRNNSDKNVNIEKQTQLHCIVWILNQLLLFILNIFK